jgi:hypothetical protein
MRKSWFIPESSQLPKMCNTERRSHIPQTSARPLTEKLKYQPTLTPAHYRQDEKGTAAGWHIHHMRSPLVIRSVQTRRWWT